MVSALMLHSEMSDYFNFIGLHGFKRIHEYQYYGESLGRRKLHHKYLDIHNKLIDENFEKSDRVHVIPDDWYKYTRLDINDSIMPKFVRSALEQYKVWEEETKQLYSDIYCVMLEKGFVIDAKIVNCYICDVQKELKEIYRMMEEMNNTGYDAIYIQEIQDKVHEQYKCKMKKFRVQK
jgi:hypothetical protein